MNDRLTAALQSQTDGITSVCEIGCMFGDQLAKLACPIKVGIEVHEPYLREARQRYKGIQYYLSEGLTYLKYQAADCFDAIILIDVVEHFELKDALLLIQEAKRVAKKKICTFIPVGNHPQDKDVFNMQGDYWQTHRSSWWPHDLEVLGFSVDLWEGFHNEPGKGKDAMFGVFTKA